MPRAYRHWLYDDERRLCSLRWCGWSYSAIGAVLGRSWQSVRYKLRELNARHPGAYRRRDRAGRWVGEGR